MNNNSTSNKAPEKPPSQVSTISYGYFREYTASLMTKADIALFVLFLYSLIQLIRSRGNGDYLIIFLGSILSGIAIFIFLIVLMASIEKKKGTLTNKLSLMAFFSSQTGWLIWLYCVFIVFYKGIWSLIGLFHGFSLGLIFEAFLFVWLGYKVISNFSKITDLERAISEGRITIIESKE
jgi:hypothetical protein